MQMKNKINLNLYNKKINKKSTHNTYLCLNHIAFGIK